MTARTVRVGEEFDTREALRNAARQARERGFDAFTIVDVDAHHYETESWAEIAAYIESPVIRDYAQAGGVMRLAGAPTLIPSGVGNQDISGRVVRYAARGLERWQDAGPQRDVVIVKRAMEMLGIDYQIVFPTPMHNLGLHPQPRDRGRRRPRLARWMGERVLAADPAIKTMLYLPFNDSEACVDIVQDLGDLPGVVGYMVTAARFRPVARSASTRAWLPFMMQRLDHEFAMRSSEAPLLERMPSDYIREMYSSDYPHWDFDVPARVYDLPFLDEAAKRAILGGNAQRVFGLADPG